MNEKEIKMHKLIDSSNEAEAITLLDSDDSIDVNFEYNQRIPVLSAANNKMYTLFEKIVNYPTFDSSIEDGFGETLLESLIYLYGSDEISPSKEEKASYKRMILAILKSDAYDFNAKDLNLDTAINIACEYPKMLWVVKALASKKSVDVNIINDFDCSALTNAIRNKNTEAIKIIAKRKDLEVREYDLKMADKYGIDLAKFGIEAAIKLQKAHEYAVALS